MAAIRILSRATYALVHVAAQTITAAPHAYMRTPATRRVEALKLRRARSLSTCNGAERGGRTTGTAKAVTRARCGKSLLVVRLRAQAAGARARARCARCESARACSCESGALRAAARAGARDSEFRSRSCTQSAALAARAPRSRARLRRLRAQLHYKLLPQRARVTAFAAPVVRAPRSHACQTAFAAPVVRAPRSHAGSMRARCAHDRGSEDSDARALREELVVRLRAQATEARARARCARCERASAFSCERCAGSCERIAYSRRRRGRPCAMQTRGGRRACGCARAGDEGAHARYANVAAVCSTLRSRNCVTRHSLCRGCARNGLRVASDSTQGASTEVHAQGVHARVLACGRSARKGTAMARAGDDDAHGAGVLRTMARAGADGARARRAQPRCRRHACEARASDDGALARCVDATRAIARLGGDGACHTVRDTCTLQAQPARWRAQAMTRRVHDARKLQKQCVRWRSQATTIMRMAEPFANAAGVACKMTCAGDDGARARCDHASGAAREMARFGDDGAHARCANAASTARAFARAGDDGAHAPGAVRAMTLSGGDGARARCAHAAAKMRAKVRAGDTARVRDACKLHVQPASWRAAQATTLRVRDAPALQAQSA
eukprot:5454610-Pleurochrysis_carterae.AAC.1